MGGTGLRPQVISLFHRPGKILPYCRCVQFDTLLTPRQCQQFSQQILRLPGVKRVRARLKNNLTFLEVAWHEDLLAKALQESQYALQQLLRPQMLFGAAKLWLSRMNEEEAALFEFTIGGVPDTLRAHWAQLLLQVCEEFGTPVLLPPRPSHSLQQEIAILLQTFCLPDGLSEVLGERLEASGVYLARLCLDRIDPGAFRGRCELYSAYHPN